MSGNLKRLVFTNTFANDVLIGTWMVAAVFLTRITYRRLAFGVDCVAVYDSTMARFWFLKNGDRETVTHARQEVPRGRSVPEEHLAQWGCGFPGHKCVELFFLLNTGVLLCPSVKGQKPMAGMHGYAPERPMSVAAFMGSVPLSHVPKSLDDLHGLMFAEAVLSPEAP